MTVKIIDKGFSKIVAELKALGTSYVAVGVQGDEATSIERKGTSKDNAGRVRNEQGRFSKHVETTYESGTTVAQVANWMEYGTETIPARSFMRSTFDEQQGNLQVIKARLLAKVIDGKMSVDQGLGQIGAWFAGKVQEKIASNVPPPLAQSTIDKKGSSVSLIDTGQMRQAITHTVKKHNS